MSVRSRKEKDDVDDYDIDGMERMETIEEEWALSSRPMV